MLCCSCWWCHPRFCTFPGTVGAVCATSIPLRPLACGVLRGKPRHGARPGCEEKGARCCLVPCPVPHGAGRCRLSPRRELAASPRPQLPAAYFELPELPETSGEDEAGEGEASPPRSSPAGGREGLGATRGQGAPTPRRSRGRAQGAGLTAGASKAPLGSQQGSSGGAKPSSATPSPLGGAHLVPYRPQPGALSALGPGALGFVRLTTSRRCLVVGVSVCPQLHAPCHFSVIPGQLPPAHPVPPHHGATDCPHLRACHAPAATPALLCWWPCPAPCQCPMASAASPAHGISKGPRGAGGVQGWQHRCPPPGCPPRPWAGTHASLLASDAAFCSLPNRGFNLPSRLAKSYPKQFPSRSSKSQ